MRRIVSFIGVFALGMASFGCAAKEGPQLARWAEPPRVEDTHGAPAVGKFRSEWRAFLTKQRDTQIERLRTYAASEQYAVNDGDGLRFVWRDEQGRLCAMANLVDASGRHDLVDEVAANENDLQLAMVTDGPLYDWMLTSGLLQEEAQLVQEPDFTSRRPGGVAPVPVALPTPVPGDPFVDQRAQWQTRRKHAHLDSAIERLEMDSAESIEVALDRLGDRLDQPPT